MSNGLLSGGQDATIVSLMQAADTKRDICQPRKLYGCEASALYSLFIFYTFFGLLIDMCVLTILLIFTPLFPFACYSRI